jgi:hypothetical protein
LNPIVVCVGDPEIAFGIGGDAKRIAEAELGRAGAGGAELG